MNKFLAILALLSAISMAAIAAWFSVVGLMALFAGAAVSVGIMIGALEVGKIIAATMLKYNWAVLPNYLRFLLCSVVAALMLVTSMGVFGYLSKAYLEQTEGIGSSGLQLSRLELQIQQEESKIKEAQAVIDQLDGTVNSLIRNSRISGPAGAREVRQMQQAERDLLATSINEANTQLNSLYDQKLQIENDVQKISNEIGPLKYVAELIYGSEEQHLDKAVRLTILVLVLLFDPFALVLMMAANHALIVSFKTPTVGSNTDIPVNASLPRIKKKKRKYTKRQIVDNTPSPVLELNSGITLADESTEKIEKEPVNVDAPPVTPATSKNVKNKKKTKKIPTPIAKKAKEMAQHKVKDEVKEEPSKKTRPLMVKTVK